MSKTLLALGRTDTFTMQQLPHNVVEESFERLDFGAAIFGI